MSDRINSHQSLESICVELPEWIARPSEKPCVTAYASARSAPSPETKIALLSRSMEIAV